MVKLYSGCCFAGGLKCKRSDSVIEKEKVSSAKKGGKIERHFLFDNAFGRIRG
jgi:hypothetical protein